MDISIHAPREGGDLHQEYHRAVHSDISIHAPREGGDAWLFSALMQPQQFQSTPPARGATVCASKR